MSNWQGPHRLDLFQSALFTSAYCDLNLDRGGNIMKFSNLLLVNAVVALVYGVGLVLLPATLLSMYGVTPGPAVNLASQLFGVELLHVGLICWFARNVSDGPAQRALIVASLIGQVFGLIVALMGTLSGVFNAVGWSAVAIYLLLGLGYAYLQFMKPSHA
jgi:hypothetical protein